LPGAPPHARAQALQDRCALACLSKIGDVVSAYELAPGTLEREAIDDRAVDLWPPLLAVAFVADAEDGGSRSCEPLDAAKDLVEKTDGAVSSGTPAII
jgi:hypothetical protein